MFAVILLLALLTGPLPCFSNSACQYINILPDEHLRVVCEWPSYGSCSVCKPIIADALPDFKFETKTFTGGRFYSSRLPDLSKPAQIGIRNAKGTSPVTGLYDKAGSALICYQSLALDFKCAQLTNQGRLVKIFDVEGLSSEEEPGAVIFDIAGIPESSDFALLYSTQIQGLEHQPHQPQPHRHHLLVSRVTLDGEIVWSYQITALEDTGFIDPTNGRVTASADRISVLFGHWNYFENTGSHQMDSIIEVNAEDGEDYVLQKTIFVSHSLAQTVTYHEPSQNFFGASLGDANPFGIRVGSFTSDRMKNEETDDLVPFMAGDRDGASKGRLGSITSLPNGNLALTYYLFPSSSISLVIFDDELEEITTKQYRIPGPGKVLALKSALWGDKIAISYLQSTLNYPTNGYGPDARDNMNQAIQFLTIVDQSGTVVFEKQRLHPSQTISDSLATLADGSLIWGNVDDDNMIYLNHLRLNSINGLSAFGSQRG